MTIAWTAFPAAQDAVAGDILVGLLGGATNQRFNASSFLFAAQNLADLNNAATARNNLGLGSSSTVSFGITSGSSSTTSATPGTIRALTGSMTGTAVSITSGNLVGVRGVVTFVGSATNAFIYGTQGKLIATGTLAAGQFQAGVFGQCDFSGATINGGQFAPIWGDYGSSMGTLTNQTGLYGIAMTNTTTAVLQGQIYLYGGAQNLLLLNTNSGLSGVTYFKDAGTSSGSAGFATGCNATKVLKVSVDGVDYFIPAFAQNT